MISEEVKKWLIKAINDYKTAERLINFSPEEIITDTLCFHCEQFVEKVLKAFLVSRNVDFKTTISEARECFDIASKVKDFVFKKMDIKEGNL